MIFYHINPLSYILFLRICWEVRVAKECTEILSRFILTMDLNEGDNIKRPLTS